MGRTTSCQFCYKMTVRNNSNQRKVLYKHVKDKHLSEALAKGWMACDVCNALFPQKSSLLVHARNKFCKTRRAELANTSAAEETDAPMTDYETATDYETMTEDDVLTDDDDAMPAAGPSKPKCQVGPKVSSPIKKKLIDDWEVDESDSDSQTSVPTNPFRETRERLSSRVSHVQLESFEIFGQKISFSGHPASHTLDDGGPMNNTDASAAVDGGTALAEGGVVRVASEGFCPTDLDAEMEDVSAAGFILGTDSNTVAINGRDSGTAVVVDGRDAGTVGDAVSNKTAATVADFPTNDAVEESGTVLASDSVVIAGSCTAEEIVDSDDSGADRSSSVATVVQKIDALTINAAPAATEDGIDQASQHPTSTDSDGELQVVDNPEPKIDGARPLSEEERAVMLEVYEEDGFEIVKQSKAHIKSEPLNFYFPTIGPHICSICADIVETNRDLVEHLSGRHPADVDQEILDIMKWRLTLDA